MVTTEEIITTSRGYKLKLEPSDNFISAKLRSTGEWEEPVAVAIERYLKPDWTFLDLGAATGYFSVIAANLCKKVIAVEARQEASETLEENIKLNDLTNIELCDFAVIADSSTPGSKDVFIKLDSKDIGNPGASYLSETDGDPVDGMPLNIILNGSRPEFIKADIEGLEQSIFAANPSVLDSAQVIVCEISHAQSRRFGGSIHGLVNLFEKHGFVVRHITGQPLTKEFIDSMPDNAYTNILCLKADATAQTSDQLANEWLKWAPSTGADIDAFYRDSTTLKDALDAWHATPERQLWTDVIVAAVKTSGAQRVLDVGAGVGHDLMALQRLGVGWLGAVEPNKLCQVHLQSAGIPFVSDISEVNGQCDIILCLDVLEHLTNPNSLIDSMSKLVDVGGLLIETTAANDQLTPLHSVSPRAYIPDRRLDHHGFTKVDSVERVNIWKRATLTRGPEPTLLMCAYRNISTHTVSTLNELNAIGWRSRIHSGDALIDRVRAAIVSHWLRHNDGDVFLMVDDDIGFTTDDANQIIQLCRDKRSIVCGAYPKHDASALTCRAFEGTNVIGFGPGGVLTEIEYAATGFMAVHREVCEAIIRKYDMPLCHEGEENAFWPMFQPAPITFEDGRSMYLSEDWAFSFRAREAGFKIWLDPSLILTHYSQVGYTIYDIKEVLH